MTALEELAEIVMAASKQQKSRQPLTLPFDGTLSATEERLLEQFAFDDPR